MGDLDADRRRQAISHRAETTRGHPAIRLLELEELGGPHLMLADLGGDVDVAVAGQGVEPLYRILRFDQIAPAFVVAQAVARAPAFDGPPPFGAGGAIAAAQSRRPGAENRRHRLADIADARQVDTHILVDRGRIDVDVDLLRTG